MPMCVPGAYPILAVVFANDIDQEADMTRIIASARRIWDDFDYLQRRSFELKTGVPVVKGGRRPRFRGTVEELEALYAAETPDHR
jgi:hypothetical protein